MSNRAIAICVLVAGLAGSAGAAVLNVKADGTGAYATIQAAINAAATGDQVVLQPGTYTGAGNRNVDFKGKAISVSSIDPDDPGIIETTIVDCQGAGRGFLFVTGETSAAILQGVTIINGHTDGDGGGIVCHSSNPTIRKCHIHSCSAGTSTTAGAGGGLSLDSANAVVSQCVLTGNSAWLGGGLYAGAGTPVVRDCVIAANTTIATTGTADSLGGGAGVGFVASNATLSNCTIVGNTSPHNRGGLYVFMSSAPVTVRNCVVWGNAGTQIDGAGLTVTFCDVQGGYAGTGNISTNPNLTADYHLPQGSSCINVGDPGYVPAGGELDIDWQPRVIHGRVDIGADEWTWPGDINGDGHVDVSDLLLLALSWGKTRGAVGYNPRCDLNGDGAADVADLLLLAGNFGN
jgi:hypothetical protein